MLDVRLRVFLDLLSVAHLCVLTAILVNSEDSLPIKCQKDHVPYLIFIYGHATFMVVEWLFLILKYTVWPHIDTGAMPAIRSMLAGAVLFLIPVPWLPWLRDQPICSSSGVWICICVFAGVSAIVMLSWSFVLCKHCAATCRNAQHQQPSIATTAVQPLVELTSTIVVEFDHSS